MAKMITIEKAKELALDYTTKKIQSTIILLLYTIDDLQDEQYFDYEFNMPPELEQCIDFIVNTVKQMDVTLLKKSEDRQNIINETLAKKDTLVSLAKCLYGYQDTLENTADHLQNQFISEGLKKTSPAQIAKKQLINDCLDFVKSGADNENSSIFATEIIGCFPVKMAREKFFDYMKQALSSFLANYTSEFAESYVNYMLDKSNLQNNLHYGKYFDDILSNIQEFVELDFENLTEDEIPPLFEDVSDLNTELTSLLDDLSVVFEALNYLQIIFTFVDDLDRFLEDNFTLKDVFYTTVNSLRTDEYEFFEDSLSKVFDEQTVTFIDAADEAFKKLSHALNQFGADNADDELNLILSVIDVIDDIFYSDIQQACFPFMSNKAIAGQKIEAGILEKTIHHFIEQLQTKLAEMPSKEQKTAKHKLIGLVACPLSPDAFIEHISNAFDDATTFLEQVIILEKVGNVFEKYNYNKFEDEDEHEHHHHHHHEHDEHCGCGEH